MNIWIVNQGEPIPTQVNWQKRLHRSTYFAKYLASNGWKVSLWTSTFDHASKEQIHNTDYELELENNLKVYFLRTEGYKNHVSLNRLRDQNLFSKRLIHAFSTVEPPDLIYCSYPPVDLAFQCVKYGLKNKIPTIVDVRDMWPDIIPYFVHWSFRLFAYIGLIPMFYQSRYCIRNATSVLGITPNFLEWAQKISKRLNKSYDTWIPFTYIPKVKTNSPPKYIRDTSINFNLQLTPTDFVISYFGSLGRNPQLETAIMGQKILKEKGYPTKLLICGDGDYKDKYKAMSGINDDIFFLGFLDSATLVHIMKISSVGLNPMPQRFDFQATINNKAVEYFSGSLPILHSPNNGYLADLVKLNRCGVAYNYNDVDDYVAKVQDLLDNKEVLKEYSKNAYKVYLENFKPKIVLEKMERHFQFIVSQKLNTFSN